jgi:GntR family transcriptional regulator, transcriptional repressor for pyruvate dehydrogenase complex
MEAQVHEGSPRPIYDHVQDRIRELIRKGALSVGDRLPSERQLAEQFNVSRNSVREALRVLAEHQIVQSRHGDGTYVCSEEGSGPTSELARTVRKQRRRVREIFEFRGILEPEIAFLAASSITEQEIDRLKVLVFDQERRLIAGEGDNDLDTAFHLSLARATHNTVLVEVLKTLSDILSESRSGSLQTEDRRRASLRTHVLIVDALEKRSPDAARNAMTQHLREVQAAVLAKADGVEPLTETGEELT